MASVSLQQCPQSNKQGSMGYREMCIHKWNTQSAKIPIEKSSCSITRNYFQFHSFIKAISLIKTFRIHYLLLFTFTKTKKYIFHFYFACAFFVKRTLRVIYIIECESFTLSNILKPCNTYMYR